MINTLAKTVLVMTLLVAVFVIPKVTNAEIGYEDFPAISIVSPTTPISIECTPDHGTGKRVMMEKGVFNSLPDHNQYDVSLGLHVIYNSPLCNGQMTIESLPSGEYVVFQGDDVSGTVSKIRYVKVFNFDTTTNTLTDAGYPPFDGNYAYGSRIISVTPSHGSIVATGTVNFTITGYITEEDFQEGTEIHINPYLKQAPLYDSYYGLPANSYEYGFFYTVTATTSGYFSISTSTNMTVIGKEGVRWEIRFPRYSLFGVNILWRNISTTTEFTLATSSQPDIFNGDRFVPIDALANFTEESCNGLLEFWTDASLCIYGLVVPDSTELTNSFVSFKDTFLTKFPFGYGTRIFDIFTGNTASSTLIGMSLTIPAELGLPVSGDIINFDPWGQVASAVNTLETDVPVGGTEPILNTLLYYWNLACTILFTMWVYHLIVKEYHKYHV